MRRAVLWPCPLWWVYVWAITRFVRHDCDRKRDWLVCHVGEFLIDHLAFLDEWRCAKDPE